MVGMRMFGNEKTILVTGGAGFIGSSLVRSILHDFPWRIINVDKLTYSASPAALASVRDNPALISEQVDICDGVALTRLFHTYRPDAVMHLAAESHVDRSIDAPSAFIQTNIVGTFTLLEVALTYWRGLDTQAAEDFRFHHISTDEVYGSLDETGYFDESSRYQPNSPYAASKASADHLVRAWHHTFGMPVVLSNCSNNYGPFQFPEKLIPLMIIRALDGLDLPVYGDGLQIRDWLHVDDHVSGLLAVLERGRVGESYNIGGFGERRNIQVVETICDILDRLVPDAVGSRRRLIRRVPDRPGHDRRYAIDSSKAKEELGWHPRQDFESGLERTVAWYLEHESWWREILQTRYDTARLGMKGQA